MNREMFCSNCGYKLNGNAKFCPQCGVKIAKKSKKAIVIVLSLLMFLIVAILLSLYFINKEELFVKKEQVISKDEKVNSNKEEVIYSSQVKSYKLYFGEENSYSETVSIYDERGNLCNFTQIDSGEETKSINYDIYYFFDESGYVEKTYDDYGKIESAYVYDNKGNETVSIYYNKDINEIYYYLYDNFYDLNDNLIEQLKYKVIDFDKWELYSTRKNVYDENNNLIESCLYYESDSTDEPFSTEIWKYNEKNELIEINGGSYKEIFDKEKGIQAGYNKNSDDEYVIKYYSEYLEGEGPGKYIEYDENGDVLSTHAFREVREYNNNGDETYYACYIDELCYMSESREYYTIDEIEKADFKTITVDEWEEELGEIYLNFRNIETEENNMDVESSVEIESDSNFTDSEEQYIQGETVEATDKYFEYIDIAILGVNSTQGELMKLTRSTSVGVLSICEVANEVKIVNLCPNLLLKYYDEEKYNQIQACYMNGPVTSMSTLNYNLDLAITDFITIGIEGLVEIVNYLGGIEVYIDSGEMYDMNNLQTYYSDSMIDNWVNIEEEGFQKIDGYQAAAYCLVNVNGSTMGDSRGKASRQQEIFMTVCNKLQNADVTTKNDIANIIYSNGYTSFTLEELVEVINMIVDDDRVEGEIFPKESMSQSETVGSHGSCTYANNLEESVKDLHKFLYGENNYIVSDEVRRISTDIEEHIEEKQGR